MANIFNQGSGRLTRGGKTRAANSQALNLMVEKMRREKEAEKNQRITMTDAVTGETQEMTRNEFDKLVLPTMRLGDYGNTVRTLKKGLSVEINGAIFNMKQAEAA